MPVSYALLQTFVESDNFLTLKSPTSPPEEILIWKGSNNKSVLDITPLVSTSMYSGKAVIVEKNDGSKNVTLTDPPGKPLFSSYDGICGNQSSVSKPIIAFNTGNEPLLSFNTYLMMRAGSPTNGADLRGTWQEPAGVVTNWIPIAMVSWGVSLNPQCTEDDLCTKCSQWDVKSLSTRTKFIPNQLVTNFSLPEWTYTTFLGDAGYVPERLNNIGYGELPTFYVCLKKDWDGLFNEGDASNMLDEIAYIND